MENSVDRNITDFILGGKAEFTIFQEEHGENKGGTVKYKVTAADGRYADNKPYVWYVRVYSEKTKKYVYQGYIKRSSLTNWTLSFYKGSEFSEENAVKALMWVLKRGDSLPSIVHVIHHGKCSVCGRKLTDIESIRLGMGPTCRQKVLG